MYLIIPNTIILYLANLSRSNALCGYLTDTKLIKLVGSPLFMQHLTASA